MAEIIAVVLIVAVAAAFIGMGAWRAMRGRGDDVHCGGCTRCRTEDCNSHSRGATNED